jgi:Family of unknown function (DUF5683)
MRLMYQLLTCLLFLCLATDDALAQATPDSVTVDTLAKKEKKGSIFSGRPGKSMIMSLIIPGSGQIYNKSYLRVPFVWGAVGGMGYLVHYNTQKYNCLKDAYVASIDKVPYTFPDHCNEFDGITDPNRLKILRDEANNARQLSIVGFSLVWLANGIDAFVNAHLKEFDIDEDLSFKVDAKFDDTNAPMRMGIFVSF